MSRPPAPITAPLPAPDAPRITIGVDPGTRGAIPVLEGLSVEHPGATASAFGGTASACWTLAAWLGILRA